MQKMRINVIPNHMEKYMALMLGYNLVFIDSLQFMNSSLDKLVNDFPNEELRCTAREIGYIDLMSRKVVYPYEYMDSCEKFS